MEKNDQVATPAPRDRGADLEMCASQAQAWGAALAGAWGAGAILDGA
jgi:hypothetical protein